MVPDIRYVFNVVQSPKDNSPFGAEMQQYCRAKGYNHQFLIVGEVTAEKHFVAKWWDLRMDLAKNTPAGSEKFDASRGLSLKITPVGTTTKPDKSISGIGKVINEANNKIWAGEKYDCKSYVDPLAAEIVGS